MVSRSLTAKSRQVSSFEQILSACDARERWRGGSAAGPHFESILNVGSENDGKHASATPATAHAVDSAVIAMPDRILPGLISSQLCRVTCKALRDASHRFAWNTPHETKDWHERRATSHRQTGAQIPFRC
jgi:hypothetical protein